MTNVVTSRPPAAAAASASSGPVSFGYSELENNNGQMASIISTSGGGDFGSGGGGRPSTLKNELKVRAGSILCIINTGDTSRCFQPPVDMKTKVAF